MTETGKAFTSTLPANFAGFTKTNIAEAAIRLISGLLESGNVLAAAEQLSAMEAFVKAVRGDETFIDLVCTELAKNGGKQGTASGAKLETAETGTSYDYGVCNDRRLAEFEIEMAMAKMKVDARKEFLKYVPSIGLEMVDKETGEEFTIYPPLKTSKSTYKVTLAK